MARRRKDVLDVRELIRRVRSGDTDRRIARDMKLSRNTVAKYRELAAGEGWLAPGAKLPEAKAVRELLEKCAPQKRPGRVSTVEPHREFVVKKREEGVEIRALHALLKERGYTGSYSSVRRFVDRLEERTPESFVRVETLPGEEAQVDFGFAGFFYDERAGKIRKGWVFVMTLSWSRHMYAEIVFDQKVETWVALHVRAFEHFQGVPKRVVVDNLRAAIVKAVLHDAEAQRSYRELAEHYGFLISPCRPRTPQHKGKVESGVRYVKRNGLAGRSFANGSEANAHLARWVMETAGCREHGTTHEQPLARFVLERKALLPLPPQRYEVSVWKRVKVHPDCHVVCDASYYSAPHRLVGKQLWLRATPERVELYYEHERVTSHARSFTRGHREMNLDHYPPEKVQGLLPEPVRIREEARCIGPQTSEFIERLLGERPLDRLRGAQGILRLGKRYGAARLEAACARALVFGQVRYTTVKTILEKGYDQNGPEDLSSTSGPLPRRSRFARTADDWR